jgi:hypothetical protein
MHSSYVVSGFGILRTTIIHFIGVFTVSFMGELIKMREIGLKSIEVKAQNWSEEK